MYTKKIQVTSGIYHVIIWLALWAGKMNQILCCDWLPERARWSYLAHSGLPAVPYNKSFIDQACAAKIAGYWPHSFFMYLWTWTPSRSINTQKKNLANIQPSWPHPWSITHTYTTKELCISVLYHAIENTMTNTIGGTCVQCIMGRLGVILSNTQLTAFLYSDWLYFLWHGIMWCIHVQWKPNISRTCKGNNLILFCNSWLELRWN